MPSICSSGDKKKRVQEQREGRAKAVMLKQHLLLLDQFTIVFSERGRFSIAVIKEKNKHIP
jgi:hypothetical protein